MGAHYGLISVKGNIDQLLGTFSELRPNFEKSAEATLHSMEEVWEWMKANEKYVSSIDWSLENLPIGVYVLRQDGERAVILDTDYLLSSDQVALARLSELFGECVSFVLETAGGCAFFYCYVAGALARKIETDNDNFTTQGEPLPQEKGLSRERFYMTESFALQKAFGIRSVEETMTETYRVVAFTDHTDWTEQKKAQAAEAAARAKQAKPWWKLW